MKSLRELLSGIKNKKNETSCSEMAEKKAYDQPAFQVSAAGMADAVVFSQFAGVILFPVFMDSLGAGASLFFALVILQSFLFILVSLSLVFFCSCGDCLFIRALASILLLFFCQECVPFCFFESYPQAASHLILFSCFLLCPLSLLCFLFCCRCLGSVIFVLLVNHCSSASTSFSSISSDPVVEHDCTSFSSLTRSLHLSFVIIGLFLALSSILLSMPCEQDETLS